MQPKRIPLGPIAWCIGLLMLGLIAVQAYWVRQNLDLQERQLDQNLQRVLAQVSEDLECREITELMAENEPATSNESVEQHVETTATHRPAFARASFRQTEVTQTLPAGMVWNPAPSRAPLPPAPPVAPPPANTFVAETSQVESCTQVWVQSTDSSQHSTVIRVETCSSSPQPYSVYTDNQSTATKSRVGECCALPGTVTDVGATMACAPAPMACAPAPMAPEARLAAAGLQMPDLPPLAPGEGLEMTEIDSNGTTRRIVIFTRQMREQADEYREQVQRVVKELVTSQMPIRRRVDSTTVHRLLVQRLAEAALDDQLEFAFAIHDPGECQRLAGDSLFLASADRVMVSPLFPDRLGTGRGAMLSVGFWGTRRTVWGNMAGLLALTGLLVAAVGFGFVYTLRTIRRQKRIDQMKDDFLDNLTHELKTPVATLRLAGEALATLPAQDSARLSRYAGIVSHESHRLQTHLERVLTLAEQERGGVRLDPSPVDVEALAREVADCYRLRAAERGGSIEVMASKTSDAPQTITADKHLLTSVLENLVDNALKYNERAPEVRIKVNQTEFGLEVAVSDNGIGMKPETLRNAFQKFYRQHTGNRHTYKGFGIGLSLCKQVVEAHGGTITAESQPGVGSTFRVHIPNCPSLKLA